MERSPDNRSTPRERARLAGACDGPLVPEQAAGEAAQLAVDHPDQCLEGLGIAGVPPIE